MYRSEDRRYTVILVQGEAETVRLVWQVSTRRAGTSFIAYVVDGDQWTATDWKVSSTCQGSPDLLAKTGGEVLGFLEQAGLLPPNSAFQRAMDAQLAATAKLRETSLRPRPPAPKNTEKAKPE